MKAIETQYKGYRFRSRLEARWAVFFDALGYQWEYEPEGFVLSDGTHYLPDFRLHSPCGLTQWVEVKPETVARSLKFEGFEKAVDVPASLVSGDPIVWFTNALQGDLLRTPEQWSRLPICPWCGRIGTSVLSDVCPTLQGMAVFCPSCDSLTPGGRGHGVVQGLLCGATPDAGSMHYARHEIDGAISKIYASALRARGSRFEFGEKK